MSNFQFYPLSSLFNVVEHIDSDANMSSLGKVDVVE